VTIKKRLFISNVLMLVIPIIASVATVAACIYLLNFVSDGAVMEMIQARQELTASGEPESSLRIWSVFGFIFLCFCAIMFFTSRFLSRMVIRKVILPLEMLSDGAYQLSEGKLDCIIDYCENDEFKPVIESFNNMAVRLKASIDEVQRNEQSRKELLASISHDLRSPLTSIKAFVEGLLDGVADTPETQREYLQIIRQKTDDINNMVSQLFCYSKMDMGNYPTYPEKLDVTTEIQDFVFASQEEYKSKGLLIQIIGTPLTRNIFADHLQLRSIFTNILDNSVKYRVKEVAVASIICTEDSGLIRIIIEDDGPGVPETELVKLFDVFYRGDPSRSDPHHSSGLGLAIASKAMERMNGRIYAENISTGGLRMIVEIPEMKREGNPNEENFDH